MLAYTAPALAIIAKAYLKATGIPATRLGLIIAGNDKLIKDMIRGADCYTASAQIVSDWFDQNWPLNLEWPSEVIRRSRRMVLQSVMRVRQPRPQPTLAAAAPMRSRKTKPKRKSSKSQVSGSTRRRAPLRSLRATAPVAPAE